MLTIEEARKFYPASDGVHGFDHVLRVYRMAEKIGKAEGADLEILRAAALLHDAQGSHPACGSRANHHEQSAEFAAGVLQRKVGAKRRSGRCRNASAGIASGTMATSRNHWKRRCCSMPTSWRYLGRSGWHGRLPMPSKPVSRIMRQSRSNS